MVDFGPSKATDIEEVIYQTKYSPAYTHRDGGYPASPLYRKAEEMAGYTKNETYRIPELDFTSLFPWLQVLQLPKCVLGQGTHNVRGACYPGYLPLLRSDDDPDPPRVDFHEAVHYLDGCKPETSVRETEKRYFGPE